MDASFAVTTRKDIASSPAPDLVPIGHLSKAHGIRGELVLVLTTEYPELASGTVYLRPRNGGVARPLAIAHTRAHHGALLVAFSDITDRNQAELLRSHTVLVSRDRLPALEEDEIWLRDLPGLRVIALEEDGPEREIGVITAAEAPAGQILWTIAAPDGTEILFPAVDEFVLSIDPDKGEARIAPPPGLLDLYR